MPLDASAPSHVSNWILIGRLRWQRAIRASRAARRAGDRVVVVQSLNDAAFYRGWLEECFILAARRPS